MSRTTRQLIVGLVGWFLDKGSWFLTRFFKRGEIISMRRERFSTDGLYYSRERVL